MTDLFPELHEVAPCPGESFAPPRVPAKIPRHDGTIPEETRKRRKGDRGTLRRFRRMLGLGDFYKARGGVDLRGVELEDDEVIKLELAIGDVVSTTILLRAGEDPKAFARTRRMSICVRGQIEDWIVPVVKQIVLRFQALTLEDLAKQIEHDELRADAAGGYERGDSFVYSYGSSAAWRNFFEGSEMYRGVPQGVRGKFVEVHHTEAECHFASTGNSEASVGFLNHFRASEEPSIGLRLTSGPSGVRLMTDLTDRDVIKGGDRKLDRALETVAEGVERGQVDADMIFVKSSCVPVVTGDDIEASLTKLRARLGGESSQGGEKKKRAIPVLNLRNEPDPAAEIMRLTMASPSFSATRSRRRAINLVGLPRIRGFAELLACLEEAGVTLNCWALPELDVESFKGFMAAELNVLHDWEWQSAERRRLIESTGIRSISPKGPFGMQGTHDWLAAIADAVGRRDELERAFARRYAAVAPAWEEKRRRAKGYRLGFVVGENGVARLADPAKAVGIPMVPMIHEIGFGVDLLVYDTDPSPAQTEARLRVSHFSSPDDLADALRESAAAAFYSDLYFDRRLTRTGKSIFAANDFEMGVEGAVATAERLLQHCKLPFFRAYSKYLGTPFLKQREPSHGEAAEETHDHG